MVGTDRRSASVAPSGRFVAGASLRARQDTTGRERGSSEESASDELHPSEENRGADERGHQ